MFEPCTPAVSISYLQGICLAENRFVDRGTLRSICTSSVGHVDPIDAPDVPLNPFPGWQPTFDLRKAIHQLQLLCSTLSEVVTASSRDEHLENLFDWRPAHIQVQVPVSATGLERESQVLQALFSHTETISFADSSLTRHALDTPNVSIFPLKASLVQLVSDSRFPSRPSHSLAIYPAPTTK